jgi:hypothetical protein
MAGRTFLGTVRLAILLAVLAFVALGAWLDRMRSTDWDGTLRVTVYPIAVGTDPGTRAYVAALDNDSLAAVGEFLADQAEQHGLSLQQPVSVRVSHAAHEPPPAAPEHPGPLSVATWSLKLRYWAWRVAVDDPLPPPDVQVFALYQPLDGASAAPDSAGMQKGLMAVAHLYADAAASGSNDVVLTHELLHTLGATDKYDLRTGQPLAPDGLGDPQQRPIYPQQSGEIMAGRIARSASEAVIPESLASMTVGPVTAREIGWLQ